VLLAAGGLEMGAATVGRAKDVAATRLTRTPVVALVVLMLQLLGVRKVKHVACR
jgi:hypothetical protein